MSVPVARSAIETRSLPNSRWSQVKRTDTSDTRMKYGHIGARVVANGTSLVSPEGRRVWFERSSSRDHLDDLGEYLASRCRARRFYVTHKEKRRARFK